MNYALFTDIESGELKGNLRKTVALLVGHKLNECCDTDESFKTATQELTELLSACGITLRVVKLWENCDVKFTLQILPDRTQYAYKFRDKGKNLEFCADIV
jgi:hypothetical protein